MTERIKLTEDDIETFHHGVIICRFTNWPKDLKKQILDDHEKAGKVDNMYIRVGQLVQENKQLKEELTKFQSYLMSFRIQLGREGEILSYEEALTKVMNLKQQLEKIEEIIEHGLAEDGFDDQPETMCFDIQKILDSHYTPAYAADSQEKE